MHDILGTLGGTIRRSWARPSCLPVLMVLAVGFAGCSGSGSTTAIDLTVTVDPALMVDTVDVAVRAPGKQDKHLTKPSQPSFLIAIFTEGLAGGAVVSLEVSGIKAGTTVVLARARVALIAGRHVPVTVRLTAACAGVLSCGPNETCEGGVCVSIPTANDGGVPGSGGAGGGGQPDGSQPDVSGGGGSVGSGGQAGGGAGAGGSAGAGGGAAGAGGASQMCAPAQHNCGGTCVDDNSPDHCGGLCDRCVAPAGATATCNGTSCDFTCGATMKKCAAALACVPLTGCCVNADCPAQAGGQTGTCDSGTHVCNYACPANMQSCTVGTVSSCIPAGGCCRDSDCTGTCQVCSATTHTCSPAVGRDDPTGRCLGTCDAAGACKSRRGQTCQTTAGGCISGSSCAPDGYCCDTACVGPCMACDIAGLLGTCTAVASGAPHGNRPACVGSGTTCGGACSGRTDGACTYPTVSCGGGPTCSGTSVVGQSACSAGACVAPAPQVCAGAFVCGAGACKLACVGDADCVATHFCAAGTCRARAVKIAASYGTTCALLNTGKIWCWGINFDGRLGQGMTTSEPVLKPTAAVTGLPATDLPTGLSAGGNHTCAVLASGAVYCWGDNSSGQLGDGTFVAKSSAVRVNGLPLPATVVAAGSIPGGGHTCAVLNDGSVWCWGNDLLGQLGDGMVRTVAPYGTSTPARVTGVTASTVMAGNSFTCAMSSSGFVQCWGYNAKGQLGTGTIPTSAPYYSTTAVSTPFAGTGAAITANGGGEHACVLTGSGAVRCWGYNVYGQLGDGTFSTDPPFGKGAAVTVAGLPTPGSIAGGGGHTCALTGAGAVWCWGGNFYGELGTGTATMGAPNGIASPVQAQAIAAGMPTALALGGSHTCALLNNGSVWCWGYNGFGQLGNNTKIDSTTAVQALGW